LPNVEILCSRVDVEFQNDEAAVENLQWRTEPFSSEELTKLKDFLNKKIAEHQNFSAITHEGYSKWALIWWQKDDQQVK
jgi:hypothetical protein